ncbi:hypothetical protein DK39_01630 [Salmonella enterica subsp. enterica serovar Weltevreden]|nr:hypothetical protein DK39_01630 [Salmonella enterica subsp. enterica serovar Weltevreden]
MRKARITAHQIIAVIRSVESGRTVKDVYREAGISEATRDNWKSGYGGMELLILNLEDVNARIYGRFSLFLISAV